MDRNINNRLVNAWYAGILGLVFACAVDWDHIWFFVFKITDPINLTGIQGRPFHTVGVFLLYAVVVSAGITALVFRRHVLIRRKERNIRAVP